MSTTATRTATDAIDGAPQAGRETTRSAIRGAAREVMSEVGGVALRAVVEMGVSQVGRMADRLDAVAERGGTGVREALTGKPAPARSDRKPVRQAARAVRARVGAAFSLVVTAALRLLQFLQRLAAQMLEALRRLARRPRRARPEPEAGADEAGPVPEAAGEAGEHREPRRARTAPRGDAPGPRRDDRSVPARPTVRRRRPAVSP
ncbi:hypothetical protein [Pseudonocardia hierapolitana]|nr:hypothetical protein [Pseudonocardia hierapolitana]